MKKFIFWFKNCVLENNRGCSGFCGTCEHYHMCSCDGLDQAKDSSFSSKLTELLDSIFVKETV